jgi:hypothetical protein
MTVADDESGRWSSSKGNVAGDASSHFLHLDLVGQRATHGPIGKLSRLSSRPYFVDVIPAAKGVEAAPKSQKRKAVRVQSHVIAQNIEQAEAFRFHSLFLHLPVSLLYTL